MNGHLGLMYSDALDTVDISNVHVWDSLASNNDSDRADWLEEWAVCLNSPWSQANERYVIDRVKISDLYNKRWQDEFVYGFGSDNALTVEVNCEDAYTELSDKNATWRCKGISIVTGDTPCEVLWAGKDI